MTKNTSPVGMTWPQLDLLGNADYFRLEDLCQDGTDHEKGECPFCDGTRPRTVSASGYVSNMWKGAGFNYSAGLTERADAIANAMRVVTSFVDTFATADHRFAVSFDPNIKTAGTNFQSRQIVISPSPVLDQTIDSEEAGLIMTAMAVHESSHVRYGTDTAKAIDNEWPRDRLALGVSNVLDDVRIDAAFIRDYPGYAHVFEPALDYVAKGTLKKLGVEKIRPENEWDVCRIALRYPAYADWDGLEETKAWWDEWAKRSMTPDPKGHVAAVREALERIGPLEQDDQPQVGPDGTGGEEADGGESDGQAMAGACIVTLVNRAAIANGVNPDQIDGASVQRLVNQALTLVKMDGVGPGDVTTAWSDENEEDGGPITTTLSAAASAAIRNAFMRSRSGHTAIDRGFPRGRCDSKSLHKIAMNDPRLFHRRTAPDPGRFLVWVMVDQSGSMQGPATTYVCQMTKALADASRFQQGMRMAAYGWTTSDGLGYWGAWLAWQSGWPIERIDDLQRIPKGGTPDSETLAWAWRAIAKAADKNERPIIVWLSDGEGDAGGMDIQVEEARSHGVEVIGVAIGSINDVALESMFGPGKYVRWTGNIVATAGPLARILTKVMR